MIKIKKSQKLVISGIILTIAYILHKLMGYAIITIITMILSTLISGLPIFKKAIISIKYRIIGIDALVTIAVIGAIVISEYWEAAAVTFLFMLGNYLETKTIEKTRSSIKKLLDLAPNKARIIKEDIELEVLADEVQVGNIILVKPGEKISVDGKIINGNAYINQSTITGESMPVNKEIGDNVFSGTIIESGFLMIEAVKVGENTTFSRILQMVEEAQDKKAQTQKFIEKFAKYYTPLIIGLAFILFILTKDIVLSLTLLVISCPGALVISTPIAIVAGIGNGAKNGVLFKGGDVIEKLGKIKVIAFDKTGTLTIGKPFVQKIKAYGVSEKDLITLAASGESYSEHPIAKAIINKSIEYDVKIEKSITNVEIITGKGLRFEYHNKKYFIGNVKLVNQGKLLEEHKNYINKEEENGQTVIIVGDSDKILGIISIADEVRKDAKGLINNLKRLGIKKTIILTGDNNNIARTVSYNLGIDEYYSQLLPEDKVDIIKKLQNDNKQIIMVGDGVNDAPALAYADVGIAIGGAGKDIAMETADTILLSEDINKLTHAIGLSRATRRNMTQNIIFALIVVSILIAGVLIDTVNLSIGMLIHEISVLAVIINAIRLLKYN